MLGLGSHALRAACLASTRDLPGELVAVGEGVAVLFEPGVLLLGGLFQLLLSFVQLEDCPICCV